MLYNLSKFRRKQSFARGAVPKIVFWPPPGALPIGNAVAASTYDHADCRLHIQQAVSFYPCCAHHMYLLQLTCMLFTAYSVWAFLSHVTSPAVSLLLHENHQAEKVSEKTRKVIDDNNNGEPPHSPTTVVAQQ